MEITGTIKVIFDTMAFDSGFRKKEFVVTTAEQYPQDIKCELYGDKVTDLDGYNVNDQVTVAINIRGKEYNGKYFVNIAAWKINRAQAEGAAPTGSFDQGKVEESFIPAGNNTADDLPF